MALSEKSIRNIFIYSFPKFAGYGMTLITLPVLTRLLTPEDFGIIILTAVFPTIAVNVLTLGLVSAAQRYYFEYRADSEKIDALIFSSQIFLYLSLVVSLFVVFFLKDYISQLILGNTKYGMAVFVMFIAAFLGQIINFYLCIYQNMEKAATHSKFTIIKTVFTSIISLLLVWYFEMSYMGMIYGSFIGAFIVCGLIFFQFNKNHKLNFSSKILFENIKYGLQIMPKSLSGFIDKFFDKYMLNNMVSLSAVGVYNIGQTVGNTMFFLMSTVWSSFQPVYYKEIFDKGKDGSVSAGRIFTIFAYIALMPVLLIILFAQEIIHIIAPAPYHDAVDIIIIISGGVATQTFGMYVGVQYAYTKKAYWIFPVAVVGTISNVAANIVLIPRFGLIGAGFSTVISTCIVNGILTFMGQKLYRIQYEWRIITKLYAIITSAIVLILYLRVIEFNGVSAYLFKLTFIAFFIFAGIKAKLITRQSIEKVQSALFNFSKRERA
ncbi:MAG: oligosaccharide flippase family protein [Ignavibacteriae bacterium]|nr:oligosaccharide flippase family protein [Ignavibacteriota bacterium]